MISGRQLTKRYAMGEVEVAALRGVDIDLYEGELMVLLGVSGSGKSTLLNILGGLDTCTTGRVAYRGGVGADLVPNDLASRYISEGADELHLVDLDGAERGDYANATMLSDMARSAPVPCRSSSTSSGFSPR